MPRGQPLHVAPECAIAALHPARAAETADAGGAPLSPAAAPRARGGNTFTTQLIARL